MFTDIDIPLEYYQETILRQSVVNAGIKFILRNQTGEKSFDKYEYCYENGIVDYIKEFVGDDAFSSVQFWQGERKGRDRADLPEYKVKLNVALCFSNKNSLRSITIIPVFLNTAALPKSGKKCVRFAD